MSGFFFSSRRRHTRSVSAFLLNRSSDLADWFLFNNLIQRNQSAAFSSGKVRSEERRVGKECRYRWWQDQLKKKEQHNIKASVNAAAITRAVISNVCLVTLQKIQLILDYI